MDGFGAKAYSKLGLETDVLNADPHRLVLILFDGALLAIQRAKGFLADRRIPEKCHALSQAIRIVDSGLCASVDPSHAPEFAARLTSLYKYIITRLLHANMRNDVKAMDEAANLLAGLRGAWVKIGPSTVLSGSGAKSDAEPLARTVSVQTGARLVHAYRA